MKMLIVAIAVVMVSVAFAENDSPNPTPGSREGSQPVQETGTNEEQKTRPPDTVSKEPPAPDKLQVSAPIGKPDVQNASNSPGQSSPKSYLTWDWWPWDAITTFTLALVIVGGFQAFVYWRQAGYMVKGLAIAEKSAQAARNSAIAAKEQAVISRETLRIGQRAYLGTENWQFRKDEKGTPIKIDVAMYNSGATPAGVIGTAWKVYMMKQLPPPPDPFQAEIKMMKPMLIQPKRDTTYAVDLIDVLKDYLADIRAKQPDANLVGDKELIAMCMQTVLDGGMPLYLSGFIIYETIDLCLLFALFLQYDVPTKRFVAIGEPDYNYEIPYDYKK